MLELAEIRVCLRGFRIPFSHFPVSLEYCFEVTYTRLESGKRLHYYYYVAVNQGIIKHVNENYMILLDVADIIRLWLCDFLIP